MRGQGYEEPFYMSTSIVAEREFMGFITFSLDLRGEVV
jgi:hypothetical protein